MGIPFDGLWTGFQRHGFHNGLVDGGKVFSYPAELDAIDGLVSQHVDRDESDEHKVRLIPYGMNSYSQYFDLLADYAEKIREVDPELSNLIIWLSGAVKRMNVRKDWSIVRYIGTQYDGDTFAEHGGLTKGRCYYWPCSREKPVYGGVVSRLRKISTTELLRFSRQLSQGMNPDEVNGAGGHLL